MTRMEETMIESKNGKNETVTAAQAGVEAARASNRVAAAVQAGMEAAHASNRMTEVAGVPVVLTPHRFTAKVMTEALEVADARAARPRRVCGRSAHLEVDSFIAHVNAFKRPESTLWADPERSHVLVIYNYHSPAEAPEEAPVPAWLDHVATYTCPKSPEWIEWMRQSARVMSQDAFADFMEVNAANLVGPMKKGEDGAAPIEILELARDLQIHVQGEFKRKLDPTTGEHSMVCKQEHSKSSTKIPRCFHVALRVFEGGAVYRIEARVRFKMREGTPIFSFTLHRADEVYRDAFVDVHAKVAKATGVPLFIGQAEAIP